MVGCDKTELAEARALLGWNAAFTDAPVAGHDWRVERVGGALCSVSSTDPTIMMNRVLELGKDGPPTREQLLDIRRVYADAGVQRFFLHIVPERKSADTDKLLADAGYEKYRGWMKFVRGAGDVRVANTYLDVRPVGPECGADFAAIAVPAFDMLPASRPVVALLTAVAGQHAFMSFHGDRPAGTGVVFIDDDIALLDWGATHPDFRRRGGQTAVLSARIRCALEKGCKTISTTTGEAVPGDPQHSYGNIKKSGFAEAYLRENWVPAAS